MGLESFHCLKLAGVILKVVESTRDLSVLAFS